MGREHIGEAVENLPTPPPHRLCRPARSVYRFIGVWQQESGKGPRLTNGKGDSPTIKLKYQDFFLFFSRAFGSYPGSKMEIFFGYRDVKSKKKVEMKGERRRPLYHPP